MAIEIREAKKEDCQVIYKLIQELANYEKMPEGPRIEYQDLEKDGFETDPPLFRAFVAVDKGKIIGHVLYYQTYCSWQGKSMFLDELYITPNYREKGVGSRLFDTVAKKAAQENCHRLDFSVLSWNTAQSFYLKKGAVDLTESEGWHQYRLSGEALNKFRD